MGRSSLLSPFTGQRAVMPLFYANALIDTENAFLKFLKTHVDNVRKRTEKVYENAQS